MFFVQMKKFLFIIFSFVVIFLAWCSNSDKQIIKIDPQEWISKNWVSIEDSFSEQLDETQYIQDLEKFLSYDILSLTEDRPFNSDFSFSVNFDEKSSVQWWVDFSQKKVSKSRNVEFSDIDFDIKAENLEKQGEPFDFSWSLSLLYNDGEMYANLHDLHVFMGEGNVVAKMYTLLWDLVIDNRVNLEINSWWIISVDENENKKLPYMVWTIKNVLKTENAQSSPNFLGSVIELLDTINSYIDLWISTNGLDILNQEISYFELDDKIIQKEFTWNFQWKDSAFDLSLLVSKKWLEVRIYNVKEYDEDVQNYQDIESEFIFSLQEKEKTGYSFIFQSMKDQQKLVDLQWKVKYDNVMKFYADFVLEPLEIISWQKISWKLDWSILKESWRWDEKIPDLTGNILLRSELLASL